MSADAPLVLSSDDDDEPTALAPAASAPAHTPAPALLADDGTRVPGLYIEPSGIPGLDDHLETIFNPIVMYKIKVAKEEARKEKMRAQLIQDGYDPDLMDDDDANAVAPAIRQNALSTLISVGARVTPMGSSQSAEAAAREDKKRQLRNIDTYLAKNMEAETTRVPLAQRKAKQEGARYVPQRRVALHALAEVKGAHAWVRPKCGAAPRREA